MVRPAELAAHFDPANQAVREAKTRASQQEAFQHDLIGGTARSQLEEKRCEIANSISPT